MQVNRGTIACRRDPDDKAEWQFSLKKSVDWVKEEEKHQVQGEAANKVEAVEWMKLRAEGLLEDVPGNSEANAALQQVLGKEKVPKALQDREPEAEASAPASSKKKMRMWWKLMFCLILETGRTQRKPLPGSPKC